MNTAALMAPPIASLRASSPAITTRVMIAPKNAPTTSREARHTNISRVCGELNSSTNETPENGHHAEQCSDQHHSFLVVHAPSVSCSFRPILPLQIEVGFQVVGDGVFESGPNVRHQRLCIIYAIATIPRSRSQRTQ